MLGLFKRWKEYGGSYKKAGSIDGFAWQVLLCNVHDYLLICSSLSMLELCPTNTGLLTVNRPDAEGEWTAYKFK